MSALIEVKGIENQYVVDDLDFEEGNISFRRFTQAEILEEDESIIKLKLYGLLCIKNVNKEFDNIVSSIPKLANVDTMVELELVYQKKDIDKKTKKITTKDGKIVKLNITKIELFDKEGYALEEIDQVKFDIDQKTIIDSGLFDSVVNKFNQDKWTISISTK